MSAPNKFNIQVKAPPVITEAALYEGPLNLKKVTGFSPTGYKTFLTNKEQFVVQYLREGWIPNKQTYQMMFGSAFDAYIKNFLATRFGHLTAEFELETLLKAQCDASYFPGHPEYNGRDDARVMGKKLMDAYRASGALVGLLREIATNSDSLQMEFAVDKTLLQTEHGPLILRGKPDLKFVTDKGVRVIYDWKCNAIRSGKSPTPGYAMCYDAFEGVKSKYHGQAHDSFTRFNFNGIIVNDQKNFHTKDFTWALQLCFYGWCLGEEVGSDFVVGIDQIVGPEGKMRVAQHRYLLDPKWQQELFANVVKAHDCVNRGLIWPELSADENEFKIRKVLSAYAPADVEETDRG